MSGYEHNRWADMASSVAGLCRAVIADEAAKVAPAASGPKLDEPPQCDEGVPEATAHAPEWCIECSIEIAAIRNARHGEVGIERQRQRCFTDLHEWIGLTINQFAEAEIARRVAEDRRDALCHCQKKLKEARAERDAARAEAERLKAQCSHDECHHVVCSASRSKPVGTPGCACKGAYERDANRIAELETGIMEARNALLKEGIARGGLEARVAEQAAEIERLSRPVDCVTKRGFFAHDANGDSVFVVSASSASAWLNKEKRNTLNERSARDAAESSLAELREFCKTKCYSSVENPHVDIWDREPPATDERLDAALAEFRKTKEPTK